MTPQELAETRVDLASMKDALRKRIGGKALQQVGSTSESVTYASVSTADLRDLIREYELKIRWGNPSALGALHIR